MEGKSFEEFKTDVERESRPADMREIAEIVKESMNILEGFSPDKEG